jgi:hypothetical protein
MMSASLHSEIDLVISCICTELRILEGASSSSDSDVNRYIVIKKLRNSIFRIWWASKLPYQRYH